MWSVSLYDDHVILHDILCKFATNLAFPLYAWCYAKLTWNDFEKYLEMSFAKSWAGFSYNTRWGSYRTYADLSQISEYDSCKIQNIILTDSMARFTKNSRATFYIILSIIPIEPE